jgi:hypothetical protein
MSNNFPDVRLDAALHTLRDHMQTVNTPDAVEGKLLAAFAQHYPRPAPRWRRLFSFHAWRTGPGLASLGGAVLAALLVLAMPTDHAVREHTLPGLDDGGDFFALVSTEDIAREPAPELVETDVAMTALASLGVPLSPDNAGDLVRAQFLVGADGRPLALRLLPALSTPLPDRG